MHGFVNSSAREVISAVLVYFLATLLSVWVIQKSYLIAIPSANWKLQPELSRGSTFVVRDVGRGVLMSFGDSKAI